VDSLSNGGYLVDLAVDGEDGLRRRAFQRIRGHDHRSHAAPPRRAGRSRNYNFGYVLVEFDFGSFEAQGHTICFKINLIDLYEEPDDVLFFGSTSTSTWIARIVHTTRTPTTP
jgi:hypothetical protein